MIISITTKGQVDGRLTHDSFSDLFLDFNINTEDLLLLNTKEIDNMSYYGKIFSNGNINIKGPTRNISFDLNLDPHKGSMLYVNLKGAIGIWKRINL